MRPVSALIHVALLAGTLPGMLAAQSRESTPLRQSELTAATATPRPLTLREASRNDRWFGLGVRDVRWALDGSGVYFRWNRHPISDDLPEEDPWFFASGDGDWAEELAPEAWTGIPGDDVRWSPDGRMATWVGGDGDLYLYRQDGGVRRVLELDGSVRAPRFTGNGRAVDFEVGSALYRYALEGGEVRMLAARVERTIPVRTPEGEWLRAQQLELLEHVRNQAETRQRRAAARRVAQGPLPQAIPVEASVQVDRMALSPDGRWVTFRARTPNARRPATQYADYVDASGYTQVREARSKVGEPRDVVRLGVAAVDPSVPTDSIVVRWIVLAEAGDEHTVPHGPVWSPDGTRAVVQFLGEDHHDLWIAELDLERGTARVLVHDHDDAWIGGPPIQGGRLEPTLMEWLPSGDLVFASERSGWSHLYKLGLDGTVTALTEGAWEVRGARLSHDGGTWLLQASREHPSEDHLYTMPAGGGPMERLTAVPGRHEGWWSPDGRRVAVVSSDNTQLPDLYLRGADPDAAPKAITVSGTDAFYQHPLVRPEIVTFPHPDGGPLWAALYRPRTPNPERAAIVHIHGGGYRQFAHRGYSVYGYALHLGFIHYMLGQGYTVLDFDYRGSAGYGRDYRTDIANAMGIKDTDGAVAAARWLAANAGIDADRIGIYGVSYGGFLTLTSLFRYPGVFGAGVARAAVTDWAHYSDGWTSRILGVPYENPEAYRRSSPIYYAEGLADPLLITHGLVDDNVHFEDAARLIQRLIELEKNFEVMVYPVEPHTVQTEASRYDLLRRQAGFFDEKLRGIPR